MNYEEINKMTDEMSEEERVEAFAKMLEQLTEDELAELYDRSHDILEAVKNRLRESGVFYIA